MTDWRGTYDVGDVVQINPDQKTIWAGCFVVVSEVHDAYVKGFVLSPPSGGPTYLRLRHEEIAYVGPAPWVRRRDLIPEGGIE